jgi:hypothetical protein
VSGRCPPRGLEHRPPQTRRMTAGGSRVGLHYNISPVTRRRSSDPAGRCGRTPRISPRTSRRNWPGSPPPVPGCTTPTCSKRAGVACSKSKGNQGKEALDRWLA